MGDGNKGDVMPKEIRCKACGVVAIPRSDPSPPLDSSKPFKLWFEVLAEDFKERCVTLEDEVDPSLDPLDCPNLSASVAEAAR